MPKRVLLKTLKQLEEEGWVLNAVVGGARLTKQFKVDLNHVMISYLGQWVVLDKVNDNPRFFEVNGYAFEREVMQTELGHLQTLMRIEIEHNIDL